MNFVKQFVTVYCVIYTFINVLHFLFSVPVATFLLYLLVKTAHLLELNLVVRVPAGSFPSSSARSGSRGPSAHLTLVVKLAIFGDASILDCIVVPKGAKTIATSMSSSSSLSSSPSSGGLAGSSTSSLSPPTRGCLHDVGVNNFESNDVYIGRAHRARNGKHLAASIWANPFKFRDCTDLNDCLAKYRSHLMSSPSLLRRLPELSGKRLLCHCAVGAGCHGDIIRETFTATLQSDVVLQGLTLGVPYDPAEFVSAAQRLQHPFDPLHLPGPLEHCIRFRMTSSIERVVAHRNQAVKFWRERAKNLESKELELHRAMHSDVSTIMVGKRILLFSEMLSSIQFPVYRRLIHLLSTGFPVTGSFPPSEVLPQAVRTAVLNVTDLWKLAKNTQEKIAARLGASDDPVLDSEVYSSTLKEVERGWLRGPFTPEDLTKRLGCWVPSRRFGIRQGGKVRCIDDYAASHINDALSSTETVEPDDLNTIAVNVRAHMAAFTAPSSSRSPSSSFSTCRRHPDHAEARLLARMWDLESAYCQLARSPGHASLTIIATWDPAAEKYAYFEQPPWALAPRPASSRSTGLPRPSRQSSSRSSPSP